MTLNHGRDHNSCISWHGFNNNPVGDTRDDMGSGSRWLLMIPFHMTKRGVLPKETRSRRSILLRNHGKMKHFPTSSPMFVLHAATDARHDDIHEILHASIDEKGSRRLAPAQSEPTDYSANAPCGTIDPR